MSDEWVETTLGDVCSFINEKIDPATLPGETQYVGLEHITPRQPSLSSHGYTSEVSSLVAVFSAGDTLFGRLRPYLHKVAIASEPGVCSPEILILRANTELVDPGFLHLLASSEDAISHAVALSAGSRMPRTSVNDLSSLEIRLPPLPVQRRIVDLLAHLDNHLANLQTEREAAEIAATTLREYLFNGAAVGALMPLAEVADWYSGSTPKAGRPEYYEGGTIPWAVIADVLNGPITETATLITEAGLKKIGRLAPIGAVLVTMYGTIGRVGLARVEMATNQAIAWGVAKSNVLPEYLFHALRQLGPRLDSLGRGATQRNINREILRSQLIRLPELERQQEVVTTLNSLDESVNALDMEIATAEQLRSSMLSALLTGSLLIPELYDSLLSEVA